MRHLVLILALVSFLIGPIGGCGGKQPTDSSDARSAEEFGDLPGLRSSPNQGLQDELARIVEEG
ncbi:MAG TPA: hypothetical protein VE890_02080, partial [Thermoguttaceae bacterium]|nr:hypothetical protein [Thermoguttaceae bacterium]